MSRCPSIRALEEFLHDGTPTAPTERADLASHVAECGRCRVRVADLRENLRLIDDLRESRPSSRRLDASISDTVAGYEIERFVGGGGQAVVVEAVQLCTMRRVAIKILHERSAEARVHELRFHREVVLASGLAHPGIVAPFDSGTTAGGRPFYAMPYIEGVPLDEFVREHEDDGAWDVVNAVRLFSDICAAVRHAHMNGVLHRDLKPGNILVDREGAPHVLDFGLAKRVDPHPSEGLTQTGAWMGTIAYAAPELLSRIGRGGDTRADVFALGLILFEMLTGRPAFDLDRPLRDLVRERTESEVPAASSLRRSVDAELDAIVRRSLAREPEDRYASASELFDDLERYRNGRPLAARRDSTLYLLRRIAVRHRSALVAGAIVVSVVVALGVWIAAAERRARSGFVQARTVARELAERLVESEVRRATSAPIVRAEELVWPHHLAPAPDAGTSSDVVRMHEPPGPLLTYWALFDLYRRHPCLATESSRTQPVVDVRWIGGRPDRVHVLRDDSSFDAWRPNTGAIESAVGERVVESAKRWTSDGRSLVYVVEAGILIEAQDGPRIVSFDLPPGATDRTAPWKGMSSIRALATDAEGTRVAIAEDSTTVRVYGIPSADGEWIHRFEEAPPGDVGVALSPDGRTLAVYEDRGDLHVFDLPSHAATTMRAPSGGRRLGCFAFGDTGAIFAMSRPGGDPRTASWEALEVWRRDPRSGSVWALANRFEGEYPFFGVVDVVDPLVVAAQRDRLVVFDTRDGSRFVLDGHRAAVHGVAVSRDGSRAVTGDVAGGLKVWETQPNAARRSWPESGGLACQSLVYDPSGTRIVVAGARTGGATGFLRVVATDDVASALFDVDQPSVVSSAAWSPGGDQIAWIRHDGVVFEGAVHSSGAVEVDHEWRLEGVGNAVAYTPDGSRLVASADREVTILRRGSAAPVARLVGPERRVPSVALSADGRRLAAASMDGGVWLWNLTDDPIRLGIAVGRHDGGVRCVRFSPDGRTLASAGDDGLVRLWSLPESTAIATLAGHASQVFALAWSPDGRWLTSSDAAGELRVWEAHRPCLLAVIPAGFGMAAGLDIDPHDGHFLVVGSLAGGIASWDLRHYDRHIAGNLEAQLRRACATTQFDPAGIAKWRSWAAAVRRDDAGYDGVPGRR